VNRALTSLVGALLEAWQEVRVHRTRVLLSLIGVAVAVCSLTTVVALGGIVQQANAELGERQSGRPATLFVSASDTTGALIDAATMDATWSSTLDRYDITYGSRVVDTEQPVAFADGVAKVATTAVDPEYGEMHDFQLSDGEWFTPSDAEQFAPTLLVNQIFWERMGAPELSTHPVVELASEGGRPGTIATIVGVYPSRAFDTEPAMFMLADHLFGMHTTQATAEATDPGGAPTQYEMWVPPSISAELVQNLERDFSAALVPPGGDADRVQVEVYRQDYAQYGNDGFLVTGVVIGGIAVLVLILGALGLVNIALVTVKQRVREIGIRRSFGATAGRVFFAVMLESVVATIGSGVIGVIAAILLVQNPLTLEFIGQGIVTVFPPFPAEAALLGLLAATVVGALAGLLPALVAVRVKVIDAIRY
jgi:putative ABC transport system permease protein